MMFFTAGFNIFLLKAARDWSAPSRSKLMMNTFKKAVANFRRSESGATLVEYGIALTIAIGVGATAFGTLSSNTSASVDAAANALPATAPATP